MSTERSLYKAVKIVYFLHSFDNDLQFLLTTIIFFFFFWAMTSIFFNNYMHFFGGYLHTYVHNWWLQPSSQDYWPGFSRHSLLCFLIQCTTGGTCTAFLRNFSWQFYSLSEFLAEICWEEIAQKIIFVFCFNV